MATFSEGPSIKYLLRMMYVLATYGELTVTDLAMMSRMNHKRCNVVLQWLLDSEYAEIRSFKTKRHVTLTQAGREYAKRLMEVSEMSHFFE